MRTIDPGQGRVVHALSNENSWAIRTFARTVRQFGPLAGGPSGSRFRARTTHAPLALAVFMGSADFGRSPQPIRDVDTASGAATAARGATGTVDVDAFSFLASHDRESLDRLIPLVYRELRTIAHRHLAAHDGEDTLNSTALVHEAYLKLGAEAGSAWQDRSHFFALASIVMRQILTDRARARVALKRGGVQRRITLEENTLAVDDQAESLLQLNDALGRVAQIAPRLVRVVEFRFFGGMSDEEIGALLGVTPRTVRRDWDKARLLLRRALGA